MGMHHMSDGTLMGDLEDGASMNHMDHMIAMIVSSEWEFIEGMISHYQEAVDTVNEVVARGGSTSAIKQLAADIVVAQEAEISEMKQWYEAGMMNHMLIMGNICQ